MFRRGKFRVKLPSRTIVLGERTLIMGVLNVTPDSFSDGGKFLDSDAAAGHALAMEQAGADLLDIGGESTRPGSEEISAEEEFARVGPVLEKLRGRLKIPISIDTQKSAVADRAVAAGAEIINDISGLTTDAEVAQVAKRRHVPVILMHMRGQPRTMQKGPFARNVMRDVLQGLRAAAARARKAGIAKSQIVLDPGIGFGKNYAQNCELLARLARAGAIGISAGGGRVPKIVYRLLAGWSASGGACVGYCGGSDGQHFRRRAYCAGTRRGGNDASCAGG